MLSSKFQSRLAAAIASFISAAVLLSASIGPAVGHSASLVI